MNLTSLDNILIIIIILCSTILVAIDKMPIEYYLGVITSIISYKFGLNTGIKKGIKIAVKE